ncbi:MAG TPA: RICIN domain-containing protein [Steroidobacteraceae bacterium]|nr:RICIN domain-containing protein [Steroidobacteraceae bacterium]
MLKWPCFHFRDIVFSLALLTSASYASDLQSYVQQCQTELQFTASQIPALSCDNGVRFINGAPSPINDFLVYYRVNDIVDLAAACRWIGEIASTDPIKKNGAVSIELLIHNRQNGETCFFSANDSALGNAYTGDANKPISAVIVSPTNFNSNHGKGNPNADDYWLQPAAVDSRTLNTNSTVPGSNSARCVGCHSQGPYVASGNIVPYLAQYGLLNNGHPTLIDMNASQHYHAVGSSGYNKPVIAAFQNWDNIIKSNNSAPGSSCSGQCHSLATNSIIGNLSPLPPLSNDNLLTSISSVIDDLEFSNRMPAYDDLGEYHWVNLDTPTNNTPSANIESESFADAMTRGTSSIVPILFHGYDANNPNVPSSPNCTNPGYDVPGAMEAHSVGVPGNYGFNTVQLGQFPDRLRTFNLKEGLLCLNSDQEQGQSCHDYSIRYLCSVSNLNGTPIWSGWYNTDGPSGDGDHEERSRHQNVCGGVTPIAIQAEQLGNGGKPIDVMGPNDRLARFSPYGLTCNASEQVDGKCSNYVVRYDGCVKPPAIQSNKTLTNVYAAGKQLTAASGSLSKGQAHNNGWNTQQWSIEPVANTEYVRLHNVPTNVYLTVTSTTEQATVGTAGFNTSISEMWVIETVAGSTAVRLKSLFSGKYLTIADPKNFTSTPDYLPIYSQGLNTAWTSQLWLVN